MITIPQHRVAAFGLLATLALVPLAGCVPASVVPPASVGRTGHAGTSTIAASPAYRQAAAAFARRDFAGAEKQLRALRADPALPIADATFLDRQIALCRVGAGGGSISVTTSAPVVATARPVAQAQASRADCGPRALLLAARATFPARPLPSLAALCQSAGTTTEGTRLAGLARVAPRVGFAASGVQMDRDALARLHHPALAWVDGNHFVAVLAVHNRHAGVIGGEDTATIHDPNQQREEEIPLTRLLRRSGGVLLTLTPQTRQPVSR